MPTEAKYQAEDVSIARLRDELERARRAEWEFAIRCVLYGLMIALLAMIAACSPTVPTGPSCAPVYQYTDTSWNAAHTAFVTAPVYACAGATVHAGAP
jgi:hypothetical protein